MKAKNTKQVEAYHAWSYQGIVKLPLLNGFIFNHGTESKHNDRTAQHRNDCKKQSYDYEVLYEEQDRVFGDKVISKSYDTDYVQKVAERLNNTVLKNSAQKAVLLHNWLETLNYLKLNGRQQGDLNALRAAKLSETECIFVPETVSLDQLLEARDYVNTHWYFVTASLRVSTKPYKDKTAKEKNMAAKPIPRAFHRQLIEILKAGKTSAHLLKYKAARIQGIELAYLISCLSELKNLEKIRVIITADDIEKHKETYEALQLNKKFELIECDSDEAMVEEYKMNTVDIKPDLDIMNPPYDGSLHLDILETVLKIRQPNSTVVSVQPCDWLENPLTGFKDGEYKKFFNNTLLSLTNLQVVDSMTAQKVFNIGTDVDLGIYTYLPNSPKFDVESVRLPIANRVFNKIIKKLETMRSLNDVLDEGAVDGWRVKLNELRPQSGGTNPEANGYSHKTWGIQLVSSTEDGIKECVFKDGYNEDGVYWTNVRSKNQFGKTDGAVFRHSIKTNDKQTALNIAESCNTDFYRNWIYLIKFNQHMPLRFLPYMENYDKVWTNEDFCKAFGLDKDESEFMCRKVDDYRTKDFINYITLD